MLVFEVCVCKPLKKRAAVGCRFVCCALNSSFFFPLVSALLDFLSGCASERADVVHALPEHVCAGTEGRLCIVGCDTEGRLAGKTVDEPTASLDFGNQQKLLRIIKNSPLIFKQIFLHYDKIILFFFDPYAAKLFLPLKQTVSYHETQCFI
jgi:hypothetical protein